MHIRLSDHFTYQTLLRFTAPSIVLAEGLALCVSGACFAGMRGKYQY